MKRGAIPFLIVMLSCGPVGLAAADSPQADLLNDADQLAYAWVDEGRLRGIELGEVDQDTVKRLKLAEERGALVKEVISGSPAAQAGLQKDDVIVRWNGEPVESARQLRRHLRETPAGRTVKLAVARGGRQIELDLKVDGQIGSIRDRGSSFFIQDRSRLGIALQSLSPQLAQYFGLTKSYGALIASVTKDSPAAKAGLKAGDVILSIGGETVEDPLDAQRVINRRGEGPVEIKVMREREERSFQVQLEKGSRFSFHSFPRISRLNVVLPPRVFTTRPMMMRPLPPLNIKMPTIRIPPIRPLVRTPKRIHLYSNSI